MQDSSIDTDKLSYQIFSIFESKFPVWLRRSEALGSQTGLSVPHVGPRLQTRLIFKANDTWRFLSDHGKSLFNNNRSSTSASSPVFCVTSFEVLVRARVQRGLPRSVQRGPPSPGTC
ncbi:hypothetical protein DVH24_020279 [Malus domestica]|uniref:Uncharacterized protein n=1 Tax=Malus domestica TaxID=3750 RepID=A0A498J7W9_MALDO|nr:hypothetical protein DVH24_020279 [Malus domestica]